MNDIGTKPLSTERLYLRKITIDDAEVMFHNWATDLKTTSFVMWNPYESMEQVRDRLAIWQAEYEKGAYRWVVTLKESGECIGTIDLVHVSKSQKTCEVGYCYGSKWWGQGYATEALQAVVSFLLNEVGFEVIEATHLPSNPASGRVMEKAGMKEEARLKSRYINPANGKREDAIIHSLIKEEDYEI